MEEDAQSSGRWPKLGNIQSQFGWGSEQWDPVEGPEGCTGWTLKVSSNINHSVILQSAASGYKAEQHIRPPRKKKTKISKDWIFVRNQRKA